MDDGRRNASDFSRDVEARTIGPYRLEGLLGRGGMGEVYRAWDERLGRHVAIKHVRDAGDAPRQRARFRREARTAAQLSHPAIVQIFDILEEDDGDWIVMELVRGPTLAELTKNGPLQFADVLAYGQQIAEGLAAAHEVGVIHRDLKAENVMVLPSGHLKILDFGLAKRIAGDEVDESISVRGEVMGTARSMSPEQARGLAVGERSDLFSLGTLLYELTTGVSPFVGESFLDTLSRVVNHVQAPADEVAEVPWEVSGLIDRLLAKSPELRPASAHLVAAELARLANSSGRSYDVVPRFDDVETWAGVSNEEASEPRSIESRPVRRLALAVPVVVLLLVLFLFGIQRVGKRSNDSTSTSTSIQDPTAAATVAATDEATEDAKLTPYELYRRGMKLLERYDKEENIEAAIASFQEMLAEDPSSAPAHAGLSLAYWRKYLRLKDSLWLDQALQIARQSIELDPYLAAGHVSLGFIYTSLGNFEQAREEVDLALNLDPENPDGHYARARLLREQGQHEESAASYKRALDSRPDDWEVLNSLGTLYYETSRYEEAEEVFLRSLEQVPDAVLTYRNLVGVYYMQGDLARAARMAQRGLEIEPSYSLCSNLGTLLFAQGQYQLAADAFERALDLGGANVPVSWGNLGDAYRWARNPQKAQEAYRHAVELLRQKTDDAPLSAASQSRLVLYLSKLGDGEQARVEMKKLEALDEKNSGVLYRQAVAYEVLGERSQALTAIESALRSGYPLDDLLKDPELSELRSEGRFSRLLMQLDGAG